MNSLKVIFLFLILSSCKLGQKEGDISTGNAPTPKLTTINGYPEGFVGCGCAFAESKAAFEKEQFIYLEKYGMPDASKNFEMIALNGKLIQWFSSTAPTDFSIQKTYSTLETVDPENRVKEGTLTITFTNGKVLETPFFGRCGC